MKKLYIFLLLLLSFTSVRAQDEIDKAAELIKTGNVQQLSKSFASTVDLTILETDDSYPAAKAAELLTDFFSQHEPKSVKILHRVTSNANYRYAVILLSTSNGNYRVSVNLRNKAGHFELNDLHIETQRQNSP